MRSGLHSIFTKRCRRNAYGWCRGCQFISVIDSISNIFPGTPHSHVQKVCLISMRGSFGYTHCDVFSKIRLCVRWMHAFTWKPHEGGKYYPARTGLPKALTTSFRYGTVWVWKGWEDQFRSDAYRREWDKSAVDCQLKLGWAQIQPKGLAWENGFERNRLTVSMEQWMRSLQNLDLNRVQKVFIGLIIGPFLTGLRKPCPKLQAERKTL